MDCLEFRRALGADPATEEPDCRQHERECEGCAAHAAELRALDGLIRQALEVDVPARLTGAPEEPTAEQRTVHRSRWFALAASVVVAVVAGIWMATPQPSQARALVNHIHHEEFALARTDEAVPPAKLRKVAGKIGARVGEDIGVVSYVKSCYFRGRWVPHLVVQGEYGPVTVMLLPHIDVESPEPVNEDGFVGTIIPAEKGSIAIIGEPEEPMGPMKKRVFGAVEWSI